MWVFVGRDFKNWFGLDWIHGFGSILSGLLKSGNNEDESFMYYALGIVPNNIDENCHTHNMQESMTQVRQLYS